MFHNYETEKITRKAGDAAENLQLYRVVRFFRPRSLYDEAFNIILWTSADRRYMRRAVVFIVKTTVITALGTGCVYLPVVPRSTQPSTLCRTVNEYQLSCWVIIINGDGGCRQCSLQADSQPKSGGLVWGSAAIGAVLYSSHEPSELSQWPLWSW